MTEQEHILYELAYAFARCIDKRLREGKPGLPRWREGSARKLHHQPNPNPRGGGYGGRGG